MGWLSPLRSPPPFSCFSCLRPAKGHVPSEPLSSLSATISRTGLCYFPEPSTPRLPRSPHPPRGFLWPLPKAGNGSELPAIVLRRPLCASGSGRTANRNRLSRTPPGPRPRLAFSSGGTGASEQTGPPHQRGGFPVAMPGVRVEAEPLPPPQCLKGGGGGRRKLCPAASRSSSVFPPAVPWHGEVEM